MNTEQKQVKNKKEERGMALIMTLGVLSILLVLALAFASNARTERKAAAANADVAAARLLAESVVERIIGINQYYSEIHPAFESESAVTASYGIDYAADTDKGDKDFLSHLTTLKGPTGTPEILYVYGGGSVTWEYIKSGPDPKDPIIGRIAYVPAGGINGINPAATVSHTSDLAVPGAVDESGANELRPGINVYEINIQNVDPGAGTLTNAMVTEMSVVLAGGKLKDEGLWPNDWDFFFDETGITSTLAKAAAKTWFSLGASSSPEAYWIDANGSGKEDPGELAHRFNMAIYTDNDSNGFFTAGEPSEWDTLTVDDILAPPTVWLEAPSTHDGTGIPWIANWEDAGNFTDGIAPEPTGAEKRAKQIAANLIDYCDKDSTATTDDPDNPTYTGNDKTPYINEVRIELDAKVTETDTGTGTYNYLAVGRILSLDVEMVNLYDTASSSIKIEAKIKGEFSCVPAGVISIPETTVTFTAVAVPAASYLTFTATNAPPIASDTVSINGIAKSAMSATFKVTGLKIKVVDDGTSAFQDYAFVEDGDTGVHVLTDVAGPTSFFLDYEIDDPRQNLLDADWGDPVETTDSLGALNAKCKPASSGDAEGTDGTTEPWEVSTAYIRNEPMKSPWEIGAIHRAGAWETINLKEYNKVACVQQGKGGKLYTENPPGDGNGGDANILDQIKFTNNVLTMGKIYLNNDAVGYKDIFRSLFMNIYVTDNVPDPSSQSNKNAAAGALLDATVANKLVDGTGGVQAESISDTRANYTYTTPYDAFDTLFISRAAIANTPYLYNDNLGLTQVGDMKKEEVIGKFINLTTVKGSAPGTRFIVLAQTIKDVGDPTSASKEIKLNKDLNGDGVLSDAATDTYDADGDGNITETLDETEVPTKIGRYDPMFDKILAEQKMILDIEFDDSPSDKRWKITTMEYVEE